MTDVDTWFILTVQVQNMSSVIQLDYILSSSKHTHFSHFKWSIMWLNGTNQIENNQTNIAKSKQLAVTCITVISILRSIKASNILVQVFQKLANTWFKVNHSILFFSCIKTFLLLFYAVWYYSNSKMKDKQYEQKTSLKITKLKSRFLVC